MIRGLLGIAVGILTFLWPGMTVTALVFLFAGYALVDGVVNIVGAIHAIASYERWGALLFEGCMGVAVAVITALWPTITLLGLVVVIAAWALVTGIAEILAAIRLRRHISGEWLLVLSGILSVVFGVLVISAPFLGALLIAVWFGTYAFIFGVVLVALGFRLRTWDYTLPMGPRIPAPVH